MLLVTLPTAPAQGMPSYSTGAAGAAAAAAHSARYACLWRPAAKHSSILQRSSTRCPAEFVRLIKDPAATHIELKGNIVFSSEYFPPQNANDQSKGINITHKVARMTVAAEAAAAAVVSTGRLERWRQQQWFRVTAAVGTVWVAVRAVRLPAHLLPAPALRLRRAAMSGLSCIPATHVHLQVEIRACTSAQDPVIVDINNALQQVYVYGSMVWAGSIKFINTFPSPRRGGLFALVSVLSVEGDGVIEFRVRRRKVGCQCVRVQEAAAAALPPVLTSSALCRAVVCGGSQVCGSSLGGFVSKHTLPAQGTPHPRVPVLTACLC